MAPAPKPHHNAGETVLEKVASSSRLDKYAAMAAVCVIVIVQTAGLVLGVDLLASVKAEWLLGIFAAVATGRRVLANGRGVRERSVETLPIPPSMAVAVEPAPEPVEDPVTQPIALPIHLREPGEGPNDEDGDAA